MKISLGDKAQLDLDKLIESRLMIVANSGGGKSFTIRRLIEQSFGKKQIIIIDPEGEFGNMRSRFDFIYAGKGGDAPVEPRSAAMLAHRLLELKASAIIDLYELPPQQRKHYVRLFCEAFVNSPKNLWHDVLVIIDEAHVFAPEKDQSESLGAVIDLASRGRKRGYCLVAATQRPAKLNKDVAAECNNKLIGRASLDIDRKRAAEELGFTTKGQVLSLRDLEPGEFYVFGPAISRDVEKITVGNVEVKPPKRGVAKQSVPAPSATVKKILSRLADLPQEAAKEAQTVAELKAEISRLKRQNPQKTVENDSKVVEKAIIARDREWDVVLRAANAEVKRLADKICKISNILGADTETHAVFNHPEKMTPAPSVRPVPMPTRDGNDHQLHMPSTPVDSLNAPLTGPEQRILDAIALSESIGVTEPEQTAVAFLAGYTYGGGGFNNPRGALKTKGLVEYRGNKIALTEAGRALARSADVPLTREMLHERVLSILPGPEKKLLMPLLYAYPEAMSNEELAAASGYKLGSGGFNNPKGRLRSLGLIDYTSPGFVRAKDFLFI